MEIKKASIKEEDKVKTYYHFYERELKPIPDGKKEILKYVYNQPGEGLEINDRNKIFEKGYLPDEWGGIRKLQSGGYVLSNNTQFVGSNGEMLQWYFGWHALDSFRYTIWDPYDHYGLTITEEERRKILDTNTTLLQKCQGVTHYVEESLIPGTDPGLLKIGFMDPEILGYDVSKIGTEACSFIVTANVEIITPEGVPNFPVVMLHMARDNAQGCELRSRFWMGYQIEDGKGVLKAPPDVIESLKPIIEDLQQHNFYEFTNLADILPNLYEEEHEHW